MARVLTRQTFTPPGGGGLGVRDHIQQVRSQQRREAEEKEGREAETSGYRKLTEYRSLMPDPLSGTIDLERFPYQEEPFYSEEAGDWEEMVLMKSTQIGASTGMIRQAIYRADQFGDRVIYYFPTDTHVGEFAVEKIGPAIETSDYLQRRIHPDSVDRQGLKQIGPGWMYLRGITSKHGVQSISAQFLVIDEYDECDPRNLAHAERRLSGARQQGLRPRIRRLGRPSLPGYGIDAAYQESDQRQWMVTCPDCGEEQELRWQENLRWRSAAGGRKILRAGRDDFETRKDVTEAWRVCRSCSSSLEPPAKKGRGRGGATPADPTAAPGPIHTGRWKAHRPGPGRVPGFHIPRMIVPSADLVSIVQASRDTNASQREIFHWADLGLAWASEDSELTEEAINRACGLGYPEMMDSYRGRFKTTGGLDVAGERDMTIRITEHHVDGNRYGIRLEEVESWERVEELIHAFQLSVLVVDSLPERRPARALQRSYPGRVWLAEYDDNWTSPAFKVKEESAMIRINRTEALDAMMDSIRGEWNRPPQIPPPHYKEQLRSPKRRVIEDSKGRPSRVYVSTGPVGDDYAHAEVYDLMATEMLNLLAGAEQIAEGQAPHDVTEDFDPGTDMGYGQVRYDPGFGRQRPGMRI